MLINNIIIRYLLIIVTTYLLSVNLLFPSDLFTGSKAGGTFYYNFEYHSSDLQSIQEIETCCPKDLDGTGNSAIFTLDYGFKLSQSGFLMISFGYANRNSSLSAIENEVINLDSTALNGQFSHDLSLEYSSILLGVGYQQDISGMIGFGLNVLYEMPLNNEFQYSENLFNPSDRGYFPDTGTRKRNEISGNYSGLSNGYFNLNLFISREFPLDADFNWVAVPKLGVSSVIGNIDKYSGWSFYSLFLSLSIYRNSIL